MPETTTSPVMHSQSIRDEGAAAIMEEHPMADDAAALARRARHAAAEFVPFDTLTVGDVFSVDRYTDVVEVEVTGAPVEAKDLFGRTMQNLPCKRLDTGAEGFYMYGPGGQTRKVTL